MAIPGGYTSLPLDTALYAQSMNKPAWDTMVWKASMGYGVLSNFINRANRAAGGSERVYEKKFLSAKLDIRGVFASITGAPTLSGGNLTIPVSGEVSQFRLRDVVQDDNYVQGRVISRTGNSIVVEPVSVTTFSASTHFQSGMTTRVLFDASPTRLSGPKETLSWIPESDYGYIATRRESSAQAKAEQIQSEVHWTKGGFWYRSWDKLTLENWERTNEDQAFWSERGIFHAGTANEYRTTGGVRWSIINNGGLYEPLTAPLTATVFDDFINETMVRSTRVGRKAVVLLGQLALSDIQTIIQPYIQQAGIHNTFGGAGVKGLDVNTYSRAGMSIDFAILPLFNNYKKFPALTSTGQNKLQKSMLFMDVADLETYGGGTRPAIQKKHFGAQEVYMTYQDGIGTDNDISDIAGASNPGIISNIMGREFNIASETGLYVTAQNMGLIEANY